MNITSDKLLCGNPHQCLSPSATSPPLPLHSLLTLQNATPLQLWPYYWCRMLPSGDSNWHLSPLLRRPLGPTVEQRNVAPSYRQVDPKRPSKYRFHPLPMPSLQLRDGMSCNTPTPCQLQLTIRRETPKQCPPLMAGRPHLQRASAPSGSCILSRYAFQSDHKERPVGHTHHAAIWQPHCSPQVPPFHQHLTPAVRNRQIGRRNLYLHLPASPTCREAR